MDLDPLQLAIFEEIHALQAECPVEPLFTLAELMALGEEEALAAVNQRAKRIADMTAHPLECCWLAEDWWLFLLLLCEKRLAQPGRVLELFVSGGIRSGKSFVVAMLMACHWKFTRRADIFCLSGTDQTSQKLQQQPFQSFLPPEALGGDKGSIKQTKHEKAKFSGGKFTDNKFNRYLQVTDEAGTAYKGGGSVEFRFFSQDPELFKGYSLTAAWWDEQCPAFLLDKVYDRVPSRAVETREKWHRDKMQVLHGKLQALVERRPGAERPHTALLGALMHGVIVGTYTPEEGMVATIRRYLQGAVKPDEYKVVEPALVDKPGVADPRVPRVAFCADPTRLTVYLHTRTNKVVDSYTELKEKSKDQLEAKVRIKLCGDVEAEEGALFDAFGSKHLVDWQDVPRVGTLYVVVDPASAKPWSIGLYLVDASERVWVIMEWPCPGVHVRKGAQWLDPGAWAVPTEGDHMNGDKGPAQKLRLNYTHRDHTYLIHEMLQRVLQKFAETGPSWQGAVQETTMVWPDERSLSGAFAMPEAVIGDKRWLGNKEQRGQVKVTLLQALVEEDHAHDWQANQGNSQRDGIILIQSALSTNIMGLPGILVVKDCKDTIFSLSTYSVPEGKDAPPDTDEACKEAIDRLRYLFMWPGAVTASSPDGMEPYGGGAY